MFLTAKIIKDYLNNLPKKNLMKIFKSKFE